MVIDFLANVLANKIQNEYACERSVKPRKGDVIFCRRGIFLYKHFGIYIGKGRVIHFADKSGAFDGEAAVVHETSLKNFAQGDDVKVMRFPRKYHAGSCFRVAENGDKYHLQSPEETVARARSKLGMRGVDNDGYNVFLNNCESFALWCKTNVSESRQLNSYIDALVD